ncbi:MAG TPA: hypothetical protein VGN16_24245 [Acidobacteriaceae bacterium]
MESNQPLRETVLRYLSNELTEPEREVIDERLLTDADYEALFRETEYDLVDAYVAKELSDTDRSRVELGVRARVWHTQGLQSQGERSSGESSHEVRRAAAASPIAAASARSLWHNRPAWAIAACALIAVVSATLVRHWGGHAGVQETPSTASSITAQTASNAHSVVLLLSGTTRSQSGLGVSLAAGTTELRVQWLPTTQAISSERYELEVVTETGTPQCHAAGVPGEMHGQSQVIEFVCPAANLQAGPSFFRVERASDGKDAPPLLETSVSIQR